MATTTETAPVERYDGQVITGKVKAWQVDKGFGFCVADDGGDDIFMHQSVITVGDEKFRAIAPGTPVEVTYLLKNGKHSASKVTGEGGSMFPGFGSKGDAAGNIGKRPVGSSGGKVKWYNTDKGFGFIVPDEGEKDVFFSIRDVDGQRILQTDEKVTYFVAEADGKIRATKIALLNQPAQPLFAPHLHHPTPAYGYPQQPPAAQPYQPYGVPHQQHQHMGYPPQQSYGGGGGGKGAGTCKWFNATKGFGFIIPSDGGKDIYFRDCVPAPSEGDSLEYDVSVVDGKTAAVNVVKARAGGKRKMEPSPYDSYDPYADSRKQQRPTPGPAYPAHHQPSPYPSQPAPAPYDPYGAGAGQSLQAPAPFSQAPPAAPQQPAYGGYQQQGYY